MLGYSIFDTLEYVVQAVNVMKKAELIHQVH